VPTKYSDAIARENRFCDTDESTGGVEITIGQGDFPYLKMGVVAAMGCGGSLPANDEKIQSRH
jgi:hypothetical protein